MEFTNCLRRDITKEKITTLIDKTSQFKPVCFYRLRCEVLKLALENETFNDYEEAKGYLNETYRMFA